MYSSNHSWVEVLMESTDRNDKLGYENTENPCNKTKELAVLNINFAIK